MRRLPELKTLILDENLFRTLKYTEFSDRLYDYPKLQHLSLIQATISKIESRAFNNPSLLSIDLSRNGLDFVSNDTISDRNFDGCTNLTKLNLEGNVFKAVSESRMERLFASLTSLRILNLGDTKLDRVDTTLWKSLMNISELYLHDNLISIIPEGTFDDLHQLTVLRLDDNQIRSVTKATFSLETRSRLTSLDLSINPFECTCALLWFRNWVADNPELFNFSNRYSRYECRNLPGKDLHMFLQNQQPCLLGHDAYVLTVVCAALLIVGLTVASQLYRYRWHIRLLLYETFRGKPDARRRQVGAEDFQYDLFVSYDSEDAHWVLDHLMPDLEQQMGLRLCIHQRDFIPGKNIVDNILDCLDSSKRVLAVFSPTFAQSQWCHFELEMCLSHVIDNNDIMVLVMLQHVPSRDMSGAMLALINTTTYIEWGDHPEIRDSFWRRMTLALKDILPALRQ